MSFPNAQQFCESALPQEFSLPMPMMKYIWSNPSTPEAYEKLNKCCKFFFIKNSILVLNNLDYNYFWGWKYCKAVKCDGTSCKLKPRHKPFKMEKLKDKKIWLAQKFCVVAGADLDYNAYFVSQFIPRIFRYNVKALYLYFQRLTYEELEFLAAGVKECFLTCNIVTYSNKKEVPVENIIKVFGDADKVFLGFNSRSHNGTCKNYYAFIDACKTVKTVTLHLISPIFNIPKFYRRLKSTKNRALIEICTRYRCQSLEKVVEEILSTQSFDFVPPVIKFYKQDETKVAEMEKLQAIVAARHC